MITILTITSLLALVATTATGAKRTPKPKYLIGRALNRVPAWKQSWQYRWRVWLPDKWQRIGACETGYGKRPGDFTWDSGKYVSAFGIYRPAWYQFGGSRWPTGRELAADGTLHLPTPWEQYQVALRIWRRYGFSGWGCRNA